LDAIKTGRTRKGRRFPFYVRQWNQPGNDGRMYRCTVHYYLNVHGNPNREHDQAVYFYLLIEGEDGYRREVKGDSNIYPIIERLRAAKKEKETA
jgi:hypothetical protein